MDDFNVHKSIVAQQRTGKHKQWVILKGDLTYKGPYVEKSNRLKNVNERTRILKSWSAEHISFPNKTVEKKSGIYTVFDNLMKDYVLETKYHEESFSDFSYRVVINSPVSQLNRLLPNLFKEHWFKESIPSLLLSLCYCYILNVGDMHLRNIIADPIKKKVWIIDYDDNLGRDRDDPYFYFSMKPAQQYMWYENVVEHYSSVVKKLNHLYSDSYVKEKKLETRVRHCQELLEQFGTKKENNKELGEMKWGGLFAGTKTFSGYSLDIVKSALQKYIRRGESFLARNAAVEMFRLGEIGGTAAVTNLCNRLVIIAHEDIGLANWSLVQSVTREILNKNRNINVLLEIVDLLAQSSKTRLGSHAFRAFTQKSVEEYAKSLGVMIDTNFSKQDLENAKKESFGDVSEELLPYLSTFRERLKNKNMNAITWAFKYLLKSQGKKVVRMRKSNDKSGMTTNPAILLWKILENFLPKETFNLMVQSYFSLNEPRLYLVNSILAVIYENTDTPKTGIKKICRKQNVKLLRGRYKLEIKDYVVDKHTLKGRQMGANRKQFVEQGAIVLPQNEKYYDSVLAKIYAYGE